MKIVIVGAGAIGRLFGGLLAEGGNEIILIERKPESAELLNQQGINFRKIGKGNHEIDFSVRVQATVDSSSITACDLSILAVKGFDTGSAVRAIAHLVSDRSPVLTIQTGINNIETMAGIVDRSFILGGVTFQGATFLNEASIRHAGIGDTLIGELDCSISDRVKKISGTFNRSNIPTSISDNIIGQIWTKGLVYSAINSLTAILKMRNGELVENDTAREMAGRIIAEGESIARARGIELPTKDHLEMLIRMCRTTAENLSPMLQDFLYNRPTEINSLCGAIVSLAEDQNIQAPMNRIFADLIRIMESRNSGEGFSL